MNIHPLIRLSSKYPALLLPVKEGECDSEEYKDAVLRGVERKGIPDFTLDREDNLSTVFTPAGVAEVLFLNNRGDFEHALKCLAYRCSPEKIPESTGASFISGLINWEKLRPHMGSDDEFSNFISDKSNYLDNLLILSSGYYSALEPDRAGFEAKMWREKSIEIRKYHELTHFVSRNKFPDNRNTIRDEVLADAIGIVAAFGKYDADMARLFLGIENGTFCEGGRLINYVEEKNLDEAVRRCNYLIELFAQYLKNIDKNSIFDILIQTEEEKIGI